MQILILNISLFHKGMIMKVIHNVNSFFMCRYYTMQINKDLKWGKMNARISFSKQRLLIMMLLLHQIDSVDITALNHGGKPKFHSNSVFQCLEWSQHKWSNSTAYRCVQ
jgi:hypothetical protein